MTLEHSFSEVKEYILDRLHKELDPRLCYHDIHHTRDDVLPAARRLAKREGVEDEELFLLLTGALFHDTGFIEQYENNEPIGVRMAREILPKFKYTSYQINLISGIILATQMPQKPKGLLEQIMCDADLDSLGRDDFFILSMKLRTERCAFCDYISVKEWFQLQLDFLENHKYFTGTARMLRDEGKIRNTEEIREVLENG